MDKRLLSLLLLLSLACSLPGLAVTSTAPPPTPTAPPTATPRPLPPTLVELDPPPGSTLGGPRQALTLYFDQPMDTASVEAALHTEPTVGGRFEWLDERTVRFTPETALPPGSTLQVALGTQARAANGLPLAAPAQATYRTPAALHVTQAVPAPDARDVDPAGDLIVAFNQPVVPLGADPASLPPAFFLDPPATGQGEWLNTSTYRFRPDPALLGDMHYTLSLNPALESLSGAPLDPTTVTWAFDTAPPRLLQIAPDTELPWPPDTPITLTFNQPMNPDSVAAHFALLDMAGRPVDGALTWDDAYRRLTFTPNAPLLRDRAYHVRLEAGAESAGGAPLAQTRDALVYVYPPLALIRSDPQDGGQLDTYAALRLYFTAPVDEDAAPAYLHFSPEADNLHVAWDDETGALTLSAAFRADTDYTLTVDADLPDRWGVPLGQSFQIAFHTAPLPPQVNFPLYNTVVFLPPDRPALPLQAASVAAVQVRTAAITLKDLVLSMASYDYLDALDPAPLSTQDVPLNAPPDQVQTFSLPLTTEDRLPPGLYLVRLSTAGLRYPPSPLLVASSRVQVTYKQGPTQALVWAVRLDDGTPVAGAAVRILDERGNLIAMGHTDADGLFQTEHDPLTDPYENTYAVIGKPGEDDFGLAVRSWNLGVAPWDFNLALDSRPPRLQTYLYTDRPIYRPGDTLYFRAVARIAFNGRYRLPDTDHITVTLESTAQPLDQVDLPLSAFGTAHGAFTLPADLPPGEYLLRSGEDAVWFRVADYRKPEVNLQVSLSSADLGEPMLAEMQATYFFGAPAANLPLRWALYLRPEVISLPDGYQHGPLSARWSPYAFGGETGPGTLIEQGEAHTDAEGHLALGIPTVPSLDSPCSPPEVCRYTLEVTLTDPTGRPVSARAATRVLPAGALYGVRPTLWVGRVGQPLTFEVQAFDADLTPTFAAPPDAEFGTVTWEDNPDWPDDPFASPVRPVFHAQQSAPVTLDAGGHGQVTFTPTEGGTYLIRISQGFAVSEALVWVMGDTAAAWPTLPNQRLSLQADRSTYAVGETAHVAIPNPLGRDVLMLVSLERGQVLDAWVQNLPPEGTTLGITLTDEHTPNVYLAVTLVDAAGRTFRQGYLNLPVTPAAYTLQVAAEVVPEQTEPGGEVTLRLHVTDAAGQPVRGEFSVAVVDRAVLALAESNAPDILSALYGEQPLAVNTASSLAAYAWRGMTYLGGVGGGGGQGEVLPAPVVRERFPDTAFWEGALVTDADGQAEVTIPLPDNLTTWDVRVRGLDAETRVGEGVAQVQVSKPVLIRPATPRFLVVGDHLQLAAVVHNNTDRPLDAQVALQADGVVLDDPAQAAQTVRLAPHAQTRVNWWITVPDGTQADLVFRVQAGAYQDAARPTMGPLPVYRNIAPQTFGTAGVVDTPGDRLEVVALPRTFTPQGGDLSVTLAPSSAGVLAQALTRVAALRLYSVEARAARLTMLAAAQPLFRQAGIRHPDLDAAFAVAATDLDALLQAQRDGGWGWWPADEHPDPDHTAEVLIALSLAGQAGLTVPQDAVRQAVAYLQAALPPVGALPAGPALDRLALAHFALTLHQAAALPDLLALARRHAELSPWAQALTLDALARLQPDAPELATLQADLSGAAQRSATGTHWESRYPDCDCFDRAEVSTAMVLYALAQRDDASADLAAGFRYLLSARTAYGDWRTPIADGWAALALSAYLARHPADLQPAFDFAATLNDHPLLAGSVQAAADLSPVRAAVPLADLQSTNALVIHHGDGPGTLYYTAHLTALRPATDSPPLDQGIHLERRVEPLDADAGVGSRVRVYLTLTTAQTLFHLQVEEPIPAGAEILQAALLTSEQGALQGESAGRLPWQSPFRRFDFGDHITWVADTLSPGTYELAYTLTLIQPGEYVWRPTHAWETYFPEVQGTAQGMQFTIPAAP